MLLYYLGNRVKCALNASVTDLFGVSEDQENYMGNFP